MKGPVPGSRESREFSRAWPDTIRSFCMAGMLGTGGTGDPDSPIAPGVAVAIVFVRPGIDESWCCCVASLEFQLELRLLFEISTEDRESCRFIEVGVAERFAIPVMMELRPASSMEVDVRGPFPRRLASRRSMKLGVVGRPIVIGVVFLTGGTTRCVPGIAETGGSLSPSREGLLAGRAGTTGSSSCLRDSDMTVGR